jgi:phosphocarrier protein HPr
MSQTVEQEFRIGAELGLHARPAGQFVSAATHFGCEIQVGRDGEWVDGRSVLSLLSLAASFGSLLSIRATGADAAEAVKVLGRMLERPTAEAAGADPRSD